MSSTTRQGSLTLLCFTAIYILWGTSFLAIRIIVHELPPLFAAGLRFTTAGIILLAFMHLRRVLQPNLQQWRSLAILALLMFVADYSTLFWAEKYIPSGLASLLSATIPLTTVAFELFILRSQKFRWPLAISTFCGFIGVAILLIPHTSSTSAPLIPCLALLAGAFCFALGGVLSRSLPLPASRPLVSGASMLLGGIVLLLLSAAFGELRPIPHISLRSALALAYLILFCSVLAFTAYMWLLAHWPATRVNSYAYVNPVIAVALGFFLAGERIDLTTVAGTAIILASVFVTLHQKSA